MMVNKKVIEARIVSRNDGATIWQLFNNTSPGKVMEWECTETFNGGLKEGTLIVSNEVNFPFSKDMLIQIYSRTLNEDTIFTYDDDIDWLQWTGKIANRPTLSEDGELEIEVTGFIDDLERIMVNKNYQPPTYMTLEEIFIDICTTYLGDDVDVFYNASKIDSSFLSLLGATGYTSITFNDENFVEVITWIINFYLGHLDYEETALRWYVDKERDLVIESTLFGTTLKGVLNEDYFFQEPDIEEDDGDVVNKVLAYRSTSADSNDVEYVNAYSDTESQEEYGIREEKLTFPYYADNDAIERFAKSVLASRSIGITRCKLKDLLTENLSDSIGASSGVYYPYTKRLPYGTYKINVFNESIYKKLTDCSTLTNWDTTNISVSSFAVDSSNYLSGRNSLKLTTASGSSGEYIEYVLQETDTFDWIPSTIYRSPQKFRLWMFFDTTMRYKLDLYDTYGAVYTVMENDYIDYTLIGDTGTEYALKGSNGSTIYTLKGRTIQNVIEDKWFQATIDVSNSGLKNIAKFRFTVLDDIAGNVYFDFFDIKIKGWETYYLPLQKVKYSVEDGSLYADAQFGRKFPEIDTKIGQYSMNGGIAYRVFTKQ